MATCQLFLKIPTKMYSDRKLDMRLRVSQWFCLFAILAVSGCGPSGPKLPDLVPVSGTVTYDGKPLDNATVTFSPMEGGQAGFGASGFTDSSGKYTLETAAGDGKTKLGAVPGKYGVTISRMVKPDGSVWKPDPKDPSGPMTYGAREELPSEYSMQPRLTAEVANDKAVHDFKLDKGKGGDPVFKVDKKK